MENESLIPKTSASAIFYSLASIALVIAGLIFFASIVKPFFIAFLVWFVINQLKEVLGRITIRGKKIPGGIRSAMAFLIILLLSYLVGELLIRNLESIAASMPTYLANLSKYIDEASALLNDPKYADYLQKWVDGLDFAGMATALVNSFSGGIANLAIVLVYVIFILMEDGARKLKLERLFPIKGKSYKKFNNNLQDISHAISSYLWQKTLISLITGLVSFIILLIMGVEYAFLWSFLIFVFNFIPYIGPLISSLFPAIFYVLVSSEPIQFVYVFAAMEGVQIVLGNFVEPKMMGKGTNIGPVIVIVALAFWGMIWGLVGMILAVPITAVLVIILSQVQSTQYMAILLSEKGDILNMES